MYRDYWLLLKNYFSLVKLIIVFSLLGGYAGFPQASCAHNAPKFIADKVTPSFEHNSPCSIDDHFIAWKNILFIYRQQPISQRLQVTNQFFNHFKNLARDNYQGVADYWKTPYEFIIEAGGDSEDFCMAKYFTLIALNVPVEKLRVIYVKALKFNQAHMVIAYYPTLEAEPLILDNLIDDILPASKRQDLIPTYGFRGKELWMAKQRGQSKSLHNCCLNEWYSLMERIRNEEGFHDIN